MNRANPSVTPALVMAKAVRRLPRWALLAFCAAYVLPGLFGRDPWKNADISAFGHMWSLALGQASWWSPQVGGMSPTTGGIVPYWLGGAFITVLQPVADPALAARIPFAMLLGVILALTWYTTYHLARTPAAQPLPLAFGGEAPPAAYARSLADGAVMALIASLGLLQLGHETTPEIVQLTASTLFLYGVAAAPNKPRQARLATLASLPLLSTSGSPAVAVMLGLAGCLVCVRSQQPELRRHAKWVGLAAALGVLLATWMTEQGLAGWQWRLDSPLQDIPSFLRLMVWFAWPTLPLAAVAVWHWRRQVQHRHVALPLLSALVGFAACVGMGGSDRALLHSLPPLAVLAAFALPVLKRGLSSAMDWFSVCFFTLSTVAIWVVFVADHTGWPGSTARSIARLVPGHEVKFSGLALFFAVLATVAWLWLVRWRTAMHRPALWKSLVLPAGGVALGWLLVMTLLLPVLDQSRSYRPLMDRVARTIPPGECVLASQASVGLITALEYFGKHAVHAQQRPDATAFPECRYLVLNVASKQVAPALPGWQFKGIARQRTERSESIALYRRSPQD